MQVYPRFRVHASADPPPFAGRAVLAFNRAITHHFICFLRIDPSWIAYHSGMEKRLASRRVPDELRKRTFASCDTCRKASGDLTLPGWLFSSQHYANHDVLAPLQMYSSRRLRSRLCRLPTIWHPVRIQLSAKDPTVRKCRDHPRSVCRADPPWIYCLAD